MKNDFKEAIALEQGKTAPAGMVYSHGDFRYFVDQREDNGKFTAFLSSPALGEGVKSEVPTIPDFDTFDEAQNALDGFALKQGYAAEESIPFEASAPGDDPEQSAPPADENTPSSEDFGQSVNTTQDQQQEDYNGHKVTRLISSQPKFFRYCWYWSKNIATSFTFAKHQPLRCIEEVCVFYKYAPTYNPQGIIVLDSCMGSGTTAAACIQSGRNFIGFEMDPQHYQTATERILKAIRKRTAT